MTRHSGWEVRVSPDVKRTVQSAAHDHGASARLPRDFRRAMNRLNRNGTRAAGAKKLKSLDLWEIRIGVYRAYFCPIRGTDVIAVGALVVKKTRRHRSSLLKTIETRVHRWRDAVEEELT